jgi:hypothetical protein
MIDWLFRNRATGEITIVQLPNIPLWIFIVSFWPARLLPPSGFKTAAEWISTAALAVWAFDEVARGVNPFRRLLGGTVLFFVIMGLFTTR